MAERERRFTVITNEKLEQEREKQDLYKKERMRSYQTNPLKEQLSKFTSEQSGRRFSIEDLLKW